MATIIVDQKGDDAAAEAAGTTLREAIAQAQASGGTDQIIFDGSVFTVGGDNTIYLTQGELVIESDLSIDGDVNADGAADIVISGDAAENDLTRLDGLGNTITDAENNTDDSDNSRVFLITDESEVALNGLVITGGRVSGPVDGGGIWVDDDSELVFTNGSIAGNKVATNTREGGGLLNDGRVVLVNADVSYNVAHSGAGIRNRGEFIAESSTITHNTAQDVGGGLFTSGGQLFGGADLKEGYALLTNVTIANNTVTGSSGTGGGIQAYDRDAFDVTRTGFVEMVNTTITGNSATQGGGGISVREATVFAYNSIILGNGANAHPNVEVVPGTIPVFFDGAGNILSGDPVEVFRDTELRPGGDGVLGTDDDALGGVLAINGGPLPTVALRDSDDNPALDAGRGVGVDTDATGAPRAMDRAGVDNGGVVDAGAVELQQGTVATPEVVTGFVVNTNGPADEFDGKLSLSEAIALAEADPDENIITFDAGVFTGGVANTIRLSETLLLTTQVTINGDIDGDGVADIVLSGDRAGDDVTTVTRNGLTITDVFNSPEYTRSTLTESRLKDNVQLLFVSGSADVSLNGLVLTGGADLEVFNTVKFGNGGAASVIGSLTVSNSTIAGNTANSQGGAFYNAGTLILTDSTLSDNLAPSGGAIFNQDGFLVTERVTIADNVADTESGNGTPRGGGIYNDGTARLTNTTFVGNRAEGAFGDGGGIFHRGPFTSFDSQSIDLLNVTITGNTALSEGGGIFLNGGAAKATNTLILGNDAPTEADVGFNSAANPMQDRGGNLYSGDVTLVFDQTEATTGVDGVSGTSDDGLAGVLADNGGRIQTVALENSGSNPALDVSSSYSVNAEGIDANGNPRAVDRAGVDNGGTLDAGAVEIQQGTVVPIGATGGLVVNSADDGNLLDGLTSISEAIAFANANPDQSIITFDAAVFTGGAANIIHLAETLQITSDITIDGDLDNDGIPDIVLSGDTAADDVTTLDANGATITDVQGNLNTQDNVRVIQITNDATVAINGLTITGGFDDSNGAGILVFPDTTLSLANSSISGNRTQDGDGGGIFVGFNGQLEMTGSLVSANYGGTFGGGIISSGTTTIAGSTIAGNAARTGGGGVYVYDGTTTIRGSSVVDNDSARGGGIQTVGDLITHGVTISGNTANRGAGINVGFAGSTFSLSGNALIQNTTLANNIADITGGGIFADEGKAVVVNTTVTGNSAGTSGGGAGVDRGRIELQNSIVLGNSAPSGAEVQAGAEIVDNLGNVLAGDIALVFDQTVVTSGPDGQTGTADDVLAGQLADNGGSVLTVQLRDADDNPAIDLGIYTVSQEILDALGNPRFVDRETGGGTGIIDAGAIEVQQGDVVTRETGGIVVNTGSDSNSFDGLTSLREAIDLANADPDATTITFDDTVFTGGTANVIRLTYGELVLSSRLTIQGDLDGDGRPDIVVSADANGDDVETVSVNGAIVTDQAANTNFSDNASRVFTLVNGSDAVVNGIVVTGGNAESGGGVAFEFGARGLFEDSAIVGNRALFGGGLSNASSGATLDNVLISNNFASSGGGGIFNNEDDLLSAVNVTIADNVAGSSGGGINNSGRLSLTNATITGNMSDQQFSRGGGILNRDIVEITNTTITGNSVQSVGGGIANSGLNTSVSMRNSIVLGNSATDDEEQQVPSNFTDLGGNITSSAAEAVFADTVVLDGLDGVAGTADDVTAGAAGDNGGFLPTVALLDNDANPALDISNSFPSTLTQTDATGAGRAVDRLGVDNGGAIDAGAVELQNGTPVSFAALPGLVVDTLDDTFDPFDGKTSIREALLEAGTREGVVTITFDDAVFQPGQDNIIRLTEGTLILINDVNINGDLDDDGLPDVTISGDALGDDATTTNNVGATITDVFNNINDADNTQVVSIENRANVALNGLTLTGGNTTQHGGGLNVGYFSSVMLSNSSIAGNVAERAGGGFNNNGVATALNVAFTQNSTGGDGGGVATRGGNGSDDNGALFGTNLTISGNYAANGAGGLLSSEPGIIVSASIVDNTSGAGGGGAEADFSDPFTLINATVSTNLAADRGAGIFGQTNSEIILQNSIILGNGAPTDHQVEKSASSGAAAFTDNGGNLITGDSTAVFAATVTRPGQDGIIGTGDDVVGAALDSTGRLFQPVSLRDDPSNPALGITPTSVILDETVFGLDFNGDGDSDDTEVTVQFSAIGSSASQVIATVPGADPIDPGDGGGGPGDGGGDPGDGGGDPGDGGGGPGDGGGGPGDGGGDPGDGGGDPGDGGGDPGDGGGDPGDGGGGPGDGGSDPGDQNQLFVFNTLGSIQGGTGTDTVDFSGLGANQVPGTLDGVIVDLDLNSAGSVGTPGQQGNIIDDLPSRGGMPVQNGGLFDIENVIGSAFDDGLFGNNENNSLWGGGGDDILSGFAGRDTLSGGDGADEFRGTGGELDGDTITDLDLSDQVRVLSEIFGTTAISFDPETGEAEIDIDGNGGADITISFGGNFDTFALAAVTVAGDTLISLAPLFDRFFDLAEGRSLASDAINGIFNQRLLEGDGTKQFEIEISDIGAASFENVLGVYEINAEGMIVDTRILFENAKSSAGETMTIEDVEAGHTLGFFVIQNGASFIAGLSDDAVLSFVNEADQAGSVADGVLRIAVNGAMVDQQVFHSFASAFNSDGARHAISGMDREGTVTIGFEDLTDLGDSDFQDVVFTIRSSDGFDM